MRYKSIFHLTTDASDLLDLFDQVETKEQLISRLEVLKRHGAADLLDCLQGLRQSVNDCLEDTLESGGSIDDDDGDDPEIDAELEKIANEVEEEGEGEGEEKSKDLSSSENPQNENEGVPTP